MIDALFTTLAAFAALLLILALLLLIPGLSYPVVALARLSQAPGGALAPVLCCLQAFRLSLTEAVLQV